MYNTIICSYCDNAIRLPEEILNQPFNMMTNHTCPHCNSILNIWVKPLKTFEVISYYPPRQKELENANRAS